MSQIIKSKNNRNDLYIDLPIISFLITDSRSTDPDFQPTPSQDQGSLLLVESFRRVWKADQNYRLRQEEALKIFIVEGVRSLDKPSSSIGWKDDM